MGGIILQYRELGKTDKQVSIVGLGCEHLDNKPYEQIKDVIDAALSYGVNILDVFMPGKEIRENIAKALGSNRGGIMIQGHIGSTDVNQQYDISRDIPAVKRSFEDMLRIFGGYIDFGMMFFIDSENDYKNVFETEFADYVQHLKQEGCIGHIGFSSHNPITAMKAIETGLPEMMLFSINPAFDILPSDLYWIRIIVNKGMSSIEQTFMRMNITPWSFHPIFSATVGSVQKAIINQESSDGGIIVIYGF